MKNKTQAPVTPSTNVISLEQLTPEQLVALKNQLKAQKKARSSNREVWVETVDKMLQEKENGQFKNTTADILDALQVAKAWDGQEREVELKKVQTRKQLHVKKDASNKDKYGYKASEHGFQLTEAKVVAWFTSQDKVTLERVATAVITAANMAK